MQSQLSEQIMQHQKIFKVVLHVIYFQCMGGVACNWPGTHVDSEDSVQESLHSLTLWVPLTELSHISRNLYPLSHFDCPDIELLRGNNVCLSWLFNVYPPGVPMHTDPSTIYYYSPFHDVACLSASQRPCARSLKPNPRCQWKIVKSFGRWKWAHRRQVLEVILGPHPFSVSLPLLLRTTGIDNPLPHSWKQSRCSYGSQVTDEQPGAERSTILRCSKLLLPNKLFVSDILAGIESVPLQGEASYI